MPQTRILPAPPPSLARYRWQPASLDDVVGIQRMSVANVDADGLESAQPAEEIEHIFGFLGGKVGEDTLLALNDDGEVAGMAFVFIPPNEMEHVAYIGGGVHADHRGRGLGTYIMEWIEARTRQHFSRFDDDLPCIMQTNCRDQQSDRLELFAQQGFTPTRYHYWMERDLDQPIPAKPLLAELALVNFEPARDEATMIAFNDSFRDHWGFFPIAADMWRMGFSGKPDFRSDLSFLAVDSDDTVVGFNLGSVSAERNAATGQRLGVMDEIGVIRGWRKRGIASALIVAGLHAYKEAGLNLAALGVDTENPSGALRLYENLGFRPVRRGVSFRKEVN